MTPEAIFGASVIVSVLAIGAAVVIGVRWLLAWWWARPPRQRPNVTAARERIDRAWVVWVVSIGLLGAVAVISETAPRGGVYLDMPWGLPEATALMLFASRAAFGYLIAALGDLSLWPNVGMRAIVKPEPDSFWDGTPAELRAVALAAWFAFYLLIIAGAIFAPVIGGAE